MRTCKGGMAVRALVQSHCPSAPSEYRVAAQPEHVGRREIVIAAAVEPEIAIHVGRAQILQS